MTTEAAEILADALEQDAQAQEAGKVDAIGLRWDDVYAEILPIQDTSEPIFAMAMRFWDDWCDASSHEWRYHEPITNEQWPQLARELANCLRAGSMPTNQIIIESFTPKPRVGILRRLKKWVRHLS